MQRRLFLTAVCVVLFGACASGTTHASPASVTHPLATTRSSRSSAATTSIASQTTSASRLNTTTSTTPRSATTSAPATPSTVRAATTQTTTGVVGGTLHGTLKGRVITIDPGHNGANPQHTVDINKLVDIGTGLKACNTVGTATNDGYPEHAFNWDVGIRVAAKLRSLGAIVVMTHPNDSGWGPCITQRAAIANNAHSAAAVSIHADGGPPNGRGFHVIEPSLLPGLTDDIFGASARLGAALRNSVAANTVMPTSTYAGSRGIVVSGIYGGLNRANVPAVFIECANMRNASDAVLVKSSTFRDQLASAIARGIQQFVLQGG